MNYKWYTVRTRQSYLLSLFLYIIWDLANLAISQEKRKGIPTRKEEIKLPLFIDDIILYIGNSTELQNKLWELISEYNTVTVYKVNVKRSTIFF